MQDHLELQSIREQELPFKKREREQELDKNLESGFITSRAHKDETKDYLIWP